MSLADLGHWLVGYAFTQCVEVPIYLRATQRWGISILASTLTHPVVWFAFPAFWPEAWGYMPMVIACELFAVTAEALWFRLHGVRRSLLLSFLANGASAVGGLLLRQTFGAP